MLHRLIRALTWKSAQPPICLLEIRSVLRRETLPVFLATLSRLLSLMLRPRMGRSRHHVEVLLITPRALLRNSLMTRATVMNQVEKSTRTCSGILPHDFGTGGGVAGVLRHLDPVWV